MAPELLYGGKLDFAVDVYTFGITAWELYTLEVPFSNVPERALHYRIIDKRERPTCPPTMDSELTNLVIQCWAHEAVSRPTFKTISMSISTIVTNVYRELTLKVIADEEKRKRETKENSEKERVVPTRREREETEARRERIEKEIEEKEAKQDKEKTAMLRRENKTKVGEDQAASERASEKIREKGSLVTQGNGQNDTATNEVNTTKGTGLGIGIPPVVTNVVHYFFSFNTFLTPNFYLYAENTPYTVNAIPQQRRKGPRKLSFRRPKTTTSRSKGTCERGSSFLLL